MPSNWPERKFSNKVVNGTPTALRSVAAHYHWRYISRDGFKVKLYSVLSVFFLAGCSAMFSDQEIEADCFPTSNQTVKSFFKELNKNRAYIWSIGGVNDDAADTPFLVENGINGFLLPKKITSPMEVVVGEEKLYFTGRVFKKWPSWGEYYIGGGRKNIKIEVFTKGNGYLVFQSDIPNSIKNELPNRCTFK